MFCFWWVGVLMPSLYTPASAPVFHVFGGTPTDTHRLPGGVHYPPPKLGEAGATGHAGASP